ncbi:hypothetical protein CORC01_11461 [Colletotrichum orchidophilum]|uniref:Uncharacterized protein n=1 Tax=Colletotrichum orchidophilum TaxID=1209926 RepID=A0A1G4AVW3_9PEZI|nr:uncharacterized protein CORC01_11461 [Colletotrichum orchidophilum]OHE93236.1 hypothetical protein CORC01_11461 [Colletotrichum orchidophilum]
MAHNMTDAELDLDWQPNGRRPQSTIARSFSQELADIFRLDEPVTDEKLDQRKQNVQSQTSELEALERRIREMEERLKNNNAIKQATGQPAAVPALSKEAQEKARSRPGTARQNQPHAPSSANMPPTPTASEGEYEFVGKDDLDDHPPRH